MSEQQAAAEGINWRQISRGLMFMGLGVFLLLNTQGWLPWSFWLDAVSFWPVLLVALGLRLVVERSNAPWAVLVSPVLVLGALTYLAMEGPPEARREWTAIQATRPAQVEHWALEGELLIADLDLKATALDSGLLLDGRATPRDLEKLSVATRDDGARVKVQREDDSDSFLLPRRRESFELALTRDLPVELDFEMVFAHGQFDLAQAPVADLRLEGAFNALVLRLGELDASSEDIRLKLEGAFNRLEIRAPPHTPVRLRVNGPNIVDREHGASEREGPSYQLRVDGAFNRVLVVPEVLEAAESASINYP